MKVVRKTEGTPYEAPLHFNVWSTRKLATADTARTAVSVSHFLPNGRVDMSGSPQEKVYFVIAGSLAVKTKAGEAVLEAGDIVYFSGGEEREGHVVGTDVCTILVVMVAP